MGLIAAQVALGLADAAAQPDCRQCQCPCPQQTVGWLLYEDDNPGAPDFWYQNSVLVEEIYQCAHGVNILFKADQNDRPHYIALIFVRPTRELYRTRSIRKLDEAGVERAFRSGERMYANLLIGLTGMFGEMWKGALDFRQLPPNQRPVLSAPQGLRLFWRGEKLLLRGYIDVYMTMIL